VCAPAEAMRNEAASERETGMNGHLSVFLSLALGVFKDKQVIDCCLQSFGNIVC
jgi:hypothetical protein